MAEDKTFTLYHGTSVLLADDIEKEGLKPSPKGALGDGVYLAGLDKASDFALNAPFRQKGEGAVVFKVVARVKNPKYIEGPDPEGKWRQEGYDSVSTRKLNPWSKNPEWCIADPSQCQIVAKCIIYYGKRTITEADFQAVAPAADKKNPTCPGRSNWGHHHPVEDGTRQQCQKCGEYRCSNCIHVHLAHCRGWSITAATRSRK